MSCQKNQIPVRFYGLQVKKTPVMLINKRLYTLLLFQKVFQSQLKCNHEINYLDLQTEKSWEEKEAKILVTKIPNTFTKETKKLQYE